MSASTVEEAAEVSDVATGATVEGATSTGVVVTVEAPGGFAGLTGVVGLTEGVVESGRKEFEARVALPPGDLDEMGKLDVPPPGFAEDALPEFVAEPTARGWEEAFASG